MAEHNWQFRPGTYYKPNNLNPHVGPYLFTWSQITGALQRRYKARLEMGADPFLAQRDYNLEVSMLVHGNYDALHLTRNSEIPPGYQFAEASDDPILRRGEPILGTVGGPGNWKTLSFPEAAYYQEEGRNRRVPLIPYEPDDE
jgi:hypothetical protein